MSFLHFITQSTPRAARLNLALSEKRRHPITTLEENIESVFKKMALSLHRAIEADLMWREFRSEENYSEHYSAIYTHRAFFEGIVDLSRFQAISGLGRFVDRSKSGMSFPELIKRLKKSQYDQNVISELSEEYQNHETIWQKIIILRGGVVAHTSRNKSEAELFREAKISNDEITLAVTVSKSLMERVAALINVRDSLISKPTTQVTSDCKNIFVALSAMEKQD